jgi:membrane-bound serine protease (ClpP class)
MSMSRVLRIMLFTVLLVACLAFPAHAQSDQPRVLLLEADDTVAPAMVEYIQRGLETAANDGYDLVVIQLNTPGGTIDAMNEIVQDLLASPLPVVVWVAPKGAMAGSAGTLITLAGHVSAMAPGTTIGAASPVGGQGEDLGETMQAKEKNILRATVRSLTEGRSAEAIQLAEDTIEKASAASAAEALQVGLIDFVAADLDGLLEQMDGFVVTVNGEEVTLSTANAQVETFTPSLIEQLLSILTNPNIVFLLITIGVQAILIEISNPGGWVAGFIGVVCLALASYGLGVLPVNWFGIVFLVVAFVLFILDIKAPTHGGLTAAGVASLIVGALVLFNSPSSQNFQRVSVPLVVASSLITGGVFFVMVMIAVRAQKAPVRVGSESLAGRVGKVQVDLNPSGIVQLGGEQWTAQVEPGAEPIMKDTQVEVVRVDGLRLVVRRKQA